MKVLLVNIKNEKATSYVRTPSVGLGYIASSLMKQNHKVEILDCVKEGYSFDDFKIFLNNKSFDVIGITVFTVSINSIKKYVDIIKSYDKNIAVVLGGPHSIIDPMGTLEIFQKADFAFCGEAEIGFPQLLHILEYNKGIYESDYENVQNLIWRKESGQIISNPMHFIENLNKLEYPAWELLHPDKYPFAPSGAFAKNKKIASIITSRGCPYSCTFCAASKISGTKIRKRNIENIIGEIKLLRKKLGIKEIHIIDDNFTNDRSFVIDFCQTLIKEGINISWACSNGVRLDSLNEELLKLMEKSGCYSLLVGIESGTQRILDHMNKKVTIATMREKIKLIKTKTNIRITGLFILGYPEETLKDIEATIKFSTELKLDRASFNNFMPLPGSDIYKELEANGELDGLSGDEIYLYNAQYAPKSMSLRELKNLQLKAYFKFYFNLRVILGLIRETKSLLQIKLIFLRFLRILRYN